MRHARTRQTIATLKLDRQQHQNRAGTIRRAIRHLSKAINQARHPTGPQARDVLSDVVLALGELENWHNGQGIDGRSLRKYSDVRQQLTEATQLILEFTGNA